MFAQDNDGEGISVVGAQSLAEGAFHTLRVSLSR